MTYELWQLPGGTPKAFMSLEKIKEVDFKDYFLAYTGELTEAVDISKVHSLLEALYFKFNEQHPADYYARSMSVSDLVHIVSEGVDKWFFCNSFGFEELPDFWKQTDLAYCEKRKQLETEAAEKLNAMRFKGLTTVSTQDLDILCWLCPEAHPHLEQGQWVIECKKGKTPSPLCWGK